MSGAHVVQRSQVRGSDLLWVASGYVFSLVYVASGYGELFYLNMRAVDEGRKPQFSSLSLDKCSTQVSEAE